MSNVSEWSVTAGSNNASPPNGWPEGMQRSAVNDCAREMMAALARWYKETLGTLVTTGTGTAYAVTTGSSHNNLNDVPMLAVRFHLANTGAATLAVDGLTARSIRKQGGVTLQAGDIVVDRIYVLVYNLTTSQYELIGGSMTTDNFPANTRLIFQQTTPPTGWTKENAATHSNAGIRMSTGTVTTGGSVAFSTSLVSRNIALDELPNTNLPTVSVAISGSDTNMTRNFAIAGDVVLGNQGPGGSFTGTRKDRFSWDETNLGITQGHVKLNGGVTQQTFLDLKFVDVITGIKN